MNIEQKRTAAETSFLAHFDSAGQALPGAANPWVASLRRDAIDAFARAGLPHRRIEAWKYTDLRNLLAEGPPPSEGAPLADAAQLASPFDAVERYLLAIVDGVVRPDLSRLDGLPKGVEILPLRELLAADEPAGWAKGWLSEVASDPGNAVIALNTAFMSDGAVIRIEAGVELDRPLELACVATAEQARNVSLRNLVVLEEGARATLIESYSDSSEAGHLTNVVTHTRIGEGACLDHLKVQRENTRSTHLSSASIRLAGDARLNSFTATLGCRLSRNDMRVEFTAPGADAAISGGYMLTGDQHGDTTLVVDHAVPSCTSTELFKGVLDGSARGVFQGNIIVRPDAQHTDGRMMTQALLLSQTAEFDTKPALEIYADDVQCGHGATSGELDEELLFYLRSRGVPYDQARALLITAFVGEAFERIANPALREIMNGLVADWLVNNSGDDHA